MVGAEWGPEAPEILERVTVNIGILEGGTAINMVAERAAAEVDIRLPVGIGSAEVLRELDKRLAAAGIAEAEVEVLAAFDPFYTPPDAALVRLTEANTAEALGRASLPVVRLGATDARYFRAAGVPTVVFGPTAHNMGGANEYVTLEDLLVTARVHAGVVADFLEGR